MNPTLAWQVGRSTGSRVSSVFAECLVVAPWNVSVRAVRALIVASLHEEVRPDAVMAVATERQAGGSHERTDRDWESAP